MTRPRSIAVAILLLGLSCKSNPTAPANTTGGPAGKAVGISFLLQPSTTGAGLPLAPIVVAGRDSAGNLDTTFSGIVKLTLGSNPGGSTLSGLDSVAAVHGLAVFDPISLDQLGTGYTLVASATGFSPVTSHAFNVHFGHPRGQSLVTTFLIGEPYGIAADSSGDVLVASVIGDVVTHLALPSLTPVDIDTFPNGSGPVHVAIDHSGQHGYAIEQFGNAVGVINVATRAITAEIPLSNSGYNLALSPNGQRLFATTADGRIYVINTGTNAVIDSMVMGSTPNGLAFSTDGTKLFISSRDSGNVAVFNAATDARIGTYTTGGKPQRLAVAPDGSRLYVANEVAGLNVIALASGTVTAGPNPTGAGYGVGITPDGAQLYLTDPTAGIVSIIDCASLSLVNAFGVGGQPRNVAFNFSGTTALVTNGFGWLNFIR
jgi:YVTN family beta-propeller protein